MRDAVLACKVYVGDLPRDASDREIERAFNYYGTLRSVWVARNPSGFAFVEFEDERDAEDAVKGLDGKTICGNRVRVEMSTGKTRQKPWQRQPARAPARRRFSPSDRCYDCGARGHYAYECRRKGNRRSSSYDRRRSYSRSRSRSRDRGRSRSRSNSRRR